MVMAGLLCPVLTINKIWNVATLALSHCSNWHIIFMTGRTAGWLMMMFSVVRSGSHWPSVQDWGLSSSLSNSSLRVSLTLPGWPGRREESSVRWCLSVSVSVWLVVWGVMECLSVSEFEVPRSVSQCLCVKWHGVTVTVWVWGVTKCLSLSECEVSRSVCHCLRSTMWQPGASLQLTESIAETASRARPRLWTGRQLSVTPWSLCHSGQSHSQTVSDSVRQSDRVRQCESVSPRQSRHVRPWWGWCWCRAGQKENQYEPSDMEGRQHGLSSPTSQTAGPTLNVVLFTSRTLHHSVSCVNWKWTFYFVLWTSLLNATFD